MSHQTVPAGNGLQWLSEAVSLILKNPTPFALMALVVGIIGMVPLLGLLVLVVLGPALNGGLMYAAREQEAGRQADFQQLFQAFREEGKLLKMILLCLPGIVCGVALLVLGMLLFGGAILAAMGAGSSETAVGAGLGFGLLLFIPLAIALGLLTFALTFFATPDVMLGNAEPMAALKQSLSACLANVGAVLIFVLLLVVAMLVLLVTVGLIPVIGQLLIGLVVTPVVCTATYIAWRQIYPQGATHETPISTPPPPPSLQA